MDFIVNTCTDPYFNMALDEYCLSQFTDRSFFYLWRNEPSIILGCNQDIYKEVDLDYCRDNEIKLVRRCTGGGMVYHDFGNLNFSFVGDASNPQIVEEFKATLIDAFKQVGLTVDATGRNDLYVNGYKFSGTAARANEQRVLFHGTILYDADLTRISHVSNKNTGKIKRKSVDSHPTQVANIRPLLKTDMDINQFTRLMYKILIGCEGKEIQLNDCDIKNIQEIAENKFRKQSWIYNEPADYTIKREGRLNSGLVIAYLKISDGKVDSILFKGDFIGLQDIVTLERIIRGCDYNRAALAIALRDIEVSDYFLNDTLDNLLNLLTD
jgi:lipoate-protein ligase A